MVVKLNVNETFSASASSIFLFYPKIPPYILLD